MTIKKDKQKVCKNKSSKSCNCSCKAKEVEKAQEPNPAMAWFRKMFNKVK